MDVDYFTRLISKAILFKTADRIVRQQKYGGYKANIVTYTLAYLSHQTSQRIELHEIWSKQAIFPTLEEAIKNVSKDVFEIISNPPDGQNVTEWCKRPDCWKRVLKIDWALGASLEKELIDVGKPTIAQKVDRGIESPTKQEQKLIEQVGTVSADVWFQVSKWAKETNNLEPWQRGLAYSIGKIVARSGEVSRKQANHGVTLLSAAEKLGFKANNATQS